MQKLKGVSMKKLITDEKPNDAKPQLRCHRKDCMGNLFGYCQTTYNCPEGDIDLMRCKSFKLRR
jgi:hypothetical protein